MCNCKNKDNSTDSLLLCLFVSCIFYQAYSFSCFSPSHRVRPGFILLTAPCSLFFPPPQHPRPCPFTLTVSPLYAYSNKGFMYCHNMINAVFAKGNYCQQKGRSTHEVITTELQLCSSASPHPHTEQRKIDLLKGHGNKLPLRVQQNVSVCVLKSLNRKWNIHKTEFVYNICDK